METQVFVQRRKALKISQVKLCQGICTQATLSKFESNRRVPALSILSKLCVRLGMTVDDLYQGESTAVELQTKLDEIERELMVENYQGVLKRLAKIDDKQIDALNSKMQLCYLRGIVNALINRQPDDILFDFARILNDLDEKHQTIFTQLAFLGSGIMYDRHQQQKQASFYFDKVYQYIRLNQHEALGDENQYYLRVLTLIFFTAEFYAAQQNYRRSNWLIEAGLKICCDERVTYYLSRIKFLAAQNAINLRHDATEIQQLLDETLAFARINRNEVVQVKLAALKCQFKQQCSN
ncbi:MULTISPECIES: helix-turn-helix domain-containing protein [Furfurilactobacillus]|uniref:Helix-turn-helix domain-containing protein n=1 Tax=Furfurilactobacillus rossiae TaxID=231049 RepID=A0A7C9N8I1_9LACO|nr:helix-turn-helix transcriptional regulator [Furfurilactobacillus milii]MYV05906.1 helix-turn-helix domain-containing protein [Furfurilactobacillus milii]